MGKEVRFDADAREYWVREDGGEWDVIPETAYNTSGLDAALIGAGKTFTDFSRGVRDLFGSETAAAEQQEADQLFAPLQEHQGLATGVGQALPYLATAPLGGASILGQGALAGGMGAVRQVGDIEDRLKTGGIEGALGAGGAMVGNMLGRTVNSIRGVYQSKAIEQAAKGGMRITPGQATGSKMLQRAEAPMQSAGMLDPLRDANQELIQGQVSKALGQQAVDLSEAGLGRTADDIGAKFAAGLDIPSPVDVGEEAIKRLRNITQDSPFIEFPANVQTMTGKQYGQVRSQLAAVARAEAKSAMKTPGKLEYVGETIEQFDEAFLARANPDQAALLKQAREQWRNLMAVERGQALTPDGYVNPKSLRSAINQTWGKTSRRAKYGRVSPETQAMMEGASSQSSRELSSVVGDSGTASRLGLGLGVPALAGGAAYAMDGDSSSATAAALMAFLASKGYARGGNLLAGQASGLLSGLGRGTAQGLMQ
jgi:hypothetical protein